MDNILFCTENPITVLTVSRLPFAVFEPRSGFAIQVLSAHLYYRALLALPSLINTWVLDCRDRQLFSTIMNYTAQYFAPVIIKAELSDVRESAAASGGARDSGDALVDGNFTVKVIPTANEVVASYLVDDHHLEIKLKIPSDWPLHKIEVKDLKRVGVEENLWRAWLLAVQQTIWSHVSGALRADCVVRKGLLI